MRYSELIINQELPGFNPVQFGHENCDPGYGFGYAIRTHWLLHYVVSGSGHFVRGGKTYDVGPGQIFVIPPYEETYYVASKENPWTYIWVGFTVDENMTMFQESGIYQKPVILSPEAGEVFQEMRSCEKKENGKSAYLAGCIWKLVSILQEETGTKATYVEKALHYMHSEYAHGITIEEVAISLGLNRKYFSGLFFQEVGVTPKEYLIRLRLNKAAELMVKYKEPPTTAALSVGYDDIYHFSKIFKKYFGMSPREYMKSVGNIGTVENFDTILKKFVV